LIIMLMLSILLFIERRKLEIRGPVLNFEISDSSIVPLAEGSANAQFPESCTSKFKTGPRISNFLLLLQKANIVLNADHCYYTL